MPVTGAAPTANVAVKVAQLSPTAASVAAVSPAQPYASSAVTSNGADGQATEEAPRRLHVSNIPFRFREPDLHNLFSVSQAHLFCSDGDLAMLIFDCILLANEVQRMLQWVFVMFSAPPASSVCLNFTCKRCQELDGIYCNFFFFSTQGFIREHCHIHLLHESFSVLVVSLCSHNFLYSLSFSLPLPFCFLALWWNCRGGDHLQRARL